MYQDTPLMHTDRKTNHRSKQGMHFYHDIFSFWWLACVLLFLNATLSEEQQISLVLDIELTTSKSSKVKQLQNDSGKDQFVK